MPQRSSPRARPDVRPGRIIVGMSEAYRNPSHVDSPDRHVRVVPPSCMVIRDRGHDHEALMHLHDSDPSPGKNPSRSWRCAEPPDVI
jgi:hypothetical protein